MGNHVANFAKFLNASGEVGVTNCPNHTDGIPSRGSASGVENCGEVEQRIAGECGLLGGDRNVLVDHERQIMCLSEKTS